MKILKEKENLHLTLPLLSLLLFLLGVTFEIFIKITNSVIKSIFNFTETHSRICKDYSKLLSKIHQYKIYLIKAFKSPKFLIF